MSKGIIVADRLALVVWICFHAVRRCANTLVAKDQVVKRRGRKWISCCSDGRPDPHLVETVKGFRKTGQTVFGGTSQEHVRRCFPRDAVEKMRQPATRWRDRALLGDRGELSAAEVE